MAVTVPAGTIFSPKGPLCAICGRRALPQRTDHRLVDTWRVLHSSSAVVLTILSRHDLQGSFRSRVREDRQYPQGNCPHAACDARVASTQTWTHITSAHARHSHAIASGPTAPQLVPGTAEPPKTHPLGRDGNHTPTQDPCHTRARPWAAQCAAWRACPHPAWSHISQCHMLLQPAPELAGPPLQCNIQGQNPGHMQTWQHKCLCAHTHGA